MLRTAETAFANGWRHIKLYFMIGLPTETDEDVARHRRARPQGRRDRQAARPQEQSHRVGRRVRPQAAHALPVGAAGRPRGDRPQARPASKARIAGDRNAQPSLSRPASPGWSRGCWPAATAGWPRSCSARSSWARASTAGTSVSLRHLAARRAEVRRRRRLVHTPRPRRGRGVRVGPPRLRAGEGLALEGLARRGRRGAELEDCRWTPCYDCGVCPGLDLQHQTGHLPIFSAGHASDTVSRAPAVHLGHRPRPRLGARAAQGATCRSRTARASRRIPRSASPTRSRWATRRQAEYAELTFAGPVPLPAIVDGLNSTFPEGHGGLRGRAGR